MDWSGACERWWKKRAPINAANSGGSMSVINFVAGEVRIRPARGADAAQIARLFYETVHRVNARDYSAAQLAAWAPAVYADADWRRRLRRERSRVAVHTGQVVGFVIWDHRFGYIDSLFVHHRFQGRGVGSALLAAVEAKARRTGLKYLFTDASITAEPFFRVRGFRRVRRLKRIHRGQVFRQYRMRKILR